MRGIFSVSKKNDPNISRLCIIPQTMLNELAVAKLTKKFVPTTLEIPEFISSSFSVRNYRASLCDICWGIFASRIVPFLTCEELVYDFSLMLLMTIICSRSSPLPLDMYIASSKVSCKKILVCSNFIVYQKKPV